LLPFVHHCRSLLLPTDPTLLPLTAPADRSPTLEAYFVEGQPGTDMAFLAALCVAVDEMFHEPQKK